MQPETPWPGPDYDPLDISNYSVTQQRHIIGLGLIADLTAQVEGAARWMLGSALGIDDPKQIDTKFLGKRMSTLARELVGSAESSNDHLIARFADWARKAKNATGRRDALIHRPVFQNRLLPARTSQAPEELNVQAVKLVQELNDLLDVAFDLNTEAWSRRITKG